MRHQNQVFQQVASAGVIDQNVSVEAWKHTHWKGTQKHLVDTPYSVYVQADTFATWPFIKQGISQERQSRELQVKGSKAGGGMNPGGSTEDHPPVVCPEKLTGISNYVPKNGLFDGRTCQIVLTGILKEKDNSKGSGCVNDHTGFPLQTLQTLLPFLLPSLRSSS